MLASVREIVVRPALPGEHDTLGAITLAAYIADGFIDPDAGYAAVLRDGARRAREATLLAAVAGDEIVGTVTYCPPSAAMNNIARPGEAEIRMLAVVPTARRRGIGEALVRACIARGRTDGLRGLVLSSQPGMAAAHRVYERLGFVRTPDRDWSPGSGRPLITYELVLVRER